MPRRNYFFHKKILILSVILTVVYLQLVVAREKAENGHDIDLNLPVGTADHSLVYAYTEKCSRAARPRNEFPKGIVGINTVPPVEEQYYNLAKELGVTWLQVEFNCLT